MSAKAIVVSGIRKSFASGKGALPVIEEVSFSVADGEFVAIVGPSGCGKSTLMNIVAGFEPADEGTVGSAASSSPGRARRHRDLAAVRLGAPG